jgi:hypothetical protein
VTGTTKSEKPELLTSVPADDVRGYPIEPRPSIKAREVIPLSATEGRDEGFGYEILSARSTDSSRYIPIDEGGVLVEEHTELVGVVARLLDRGRIIETPSVLLCSAATYDWFSHDPRSAAFTPTTVIAKIPELGSRVRTRVDRIRASLPPGPTKPYGDRPPRLLSG